MCRIQVAENKRQKEILEEARDLKKRDTSYTVGGIVS